ncbi:transposase [Streptomyces sp. NBC_00344]|uniref:transposase n=1 Tax=Streptomyces sp. NBC_00344 TaxID=2975720 RepID=UPI002E21EAC2
MIELLLPEQGPKLMAGRSRVPDRQTLCGVLFVLQTGIRWEYQATSRLGGDSRTRVSVFRDCKTNGCAPYDGRLTDRHVRFP